MTDSRCEPTVTGLAARGEAKLQEHSQQGAKKQPNFTRDKWSTLGDIAETLTKMKEQGMTRGSVLYAVDRVFWETEQ